VYFLAKFLFESDADERRELLEEVVDADAGAQVLEGPRLHEDEAHGCELGSVEQEEQRAPVELQADLDERARVAPDELAVRAELVVLAV
jgi:hypothetical protein